MSTAAIYDMRFRSESAYEGLRAVTAAVKDTRAFDGNEGVQVWVDDSDPSHVAVIEQWSSPDANDTYQAWRKGDGARTDVNAALAEPPTLTVWTVSVRL